MVTLIQLPEKARLTEVCERFHARRLSLFGSAARGEMKENSDVDLLVEFEPNYPIGYFDLVDMSETLSPLFGGRRIDLVTSPSLHPLIRKYVMLDLRPLYEG